jgi:hypothetical protein
MFFFAPKDSPIEWSASSQEFARIQLGDGVNAFS